MPWIIFFDTCRWIPWLFPDFWQNYQIPCPFPAREYSITSWVVGNFWITTQAKPPITTPRASGPRGGNGWFGACGNSKITNHECGGAFTTSLAQNMTFSNGESKLKKRYPPDLTFLLKWRHISQWKCLVRRDSFSQENANLWPFWAVLNTITRAIIDRMSATAAQH